MPSIRITRFGGIRPAVAGEHLDPRYAQEAHNLRLRDLTLRPFLAPLEEQVEPHPVRSIYRSADSSTCCSRLLTWDHCVSVMEAPDPGACPTGDMLLVFHQGDRPAEPQRYMRCEDAYYPIRVPKPEKVLTLTRLAAGTIEGKLEGSGPDARAYTYTWVDRFGVESIPAMPSRQVRSYDDEVWRLDGFDTPPPNAEFVRIYRSTTQFEDGRQVKNPMDSSFQLVEEVPIDANWAGSFVDSRRLLHMDYGTLTTFENCDIPERMEQVVVTEQGYLVGFRGNELFISERYEAHNWPEKYRQMLPDKIVALAVRYDIVFIATTGRPYKASIAFARMGDTADATIEVIPFTEHYPCIGAQTMVPTDNGAAYCTHKGIVRLPTNGNAKLESRFRVDEDDFRDFAPNLAVYHNGKYLASRSPAGRGIIVDFEDRVEGDIDIGDLVTADLRWDAVHSGRDGYVYFSRGNTVYRWNAGRQPMPYRWRSKVFVQPGLVAFAAAKVVADYGPPIQFRLFADGSLYAEDVVSSSAPFRLPARGRGINWEVEVSGATRIREIHVATSMAELTEAQG
jgi:hypothetical protein